MREKLLSLEEAVSLCRDGSLLGLTVSTLDNAPMAFLRELLRRDRRYLRVVPCREEALMSTFSLVLEP
jgi:hypothetical protein